jgi:cellulose synthase/poly-beta-1,6-N-acetylglucosamine synthase-like glycosyltransferase
METIVVSDGSTDRTEEIARQFESRGVRLIAKPRGGKATALNEGIAQARGEILVLTDVRQVLEPGSVRQMVACFADSKVGVVSGDLLMRSGTHEEEMSFSLYWRFERWLRKELSKLDSTMGATGPFYALRRELAVSIPVDTLLDDVYLPLAAFFRGYRLIVDEEARAIDYPTTLTTEFGRKVRTLAGMYQIMWQYPALLTFHNRMLLHFVSYKVGRLALPWIVALIFAVSFGLPSPWNWIVIVPQAGFYLLALADVWVGPTSGLKRLTTPARTFVTMLAAAAAAVRVFFVAPRDLWQKPTQLGRTITNPK